jgi:hypothetical protein
LFLGLARCKMDIDKAHGGVVHDHPSDDGSLVPWSVVGRHVGTLVSPCCRRFRQCHYDYFRRCSYVQA